MKHGTQDQAELIRTAITEGGIDQLDTILEAIHGTGALDYTMGRAEQHVQKAKACLEGIPDSPELRAMSMLADFALNRTF